MTTETRLLDHGEMIREAGHCDRPGCHNEAEWKAVYTDGSYAYLCPLHIRDEANKARRAARTGSAA
jgi:hypothetical protein